MFMTIEKIEKDTFGMINRRTYNRRHRRLKLKPARLDLDAYAPVSLKYLVR